MTKKEEKFVATVLEHYKNHGRQSLPWRKTRDPYKILVSEIMCQQTQVDRVIPKYKTFLKKFPTLKHLASAPLGDVLREWQGLGYNRRAKMLHECAKTIVKAFKGQTPKTMEELVTLPGIGPYTAGAVVGFAFNTPVPIIETNIRSAILHHFFVDATDVTDREVMVYVERTLPKENAREWYAALMDYGSHLKKMHGNPNSRSKHYTKQSTFRGSDREIRGAILRLLAQKHETRAVLLRELPFEDIRIDAQLEKLEKENLIARTGRMYSLPD
jgi:A/G-specific adenine glycosylase